MNVMRKLTNVKKIVTMQSVVTTATVVELVIDFTATTEPVKVS